MDPPTLRCGNPNFSLARGSPSHVPVFQGVGSDIRAEHAKGDENDDGDIFKMDFRKFPPITPCPTF